MSLKTGIFQLFYFTFLHNADAIAYFIGILFIFVLMLKKPSRILTLFLLSFILLELRFQYLKHIVDPLYDQTVGAMLQTSTFLRTRKFIDIVLNDIVPMGLYVSSWGCMFAGMYFAVFESSHFVLKKKKKADTLP